MKRVKVNVGDRVKIIYTGGQHTTYPDMAKLMNLTKYKHGYATPRDIFGIITNIRKDRTGQTFYGIRTDREYDVIFSNSVSKECFEHRGVAVSLPEELFEL